MSLFFRCADRLRGARRAAGLSLNELVTLVSLRKAKVMDWERGTATPSPSELVALAHVFDAFGVPFMSATDRTALALPQPAGGENWRRRMTEFVASRFGSQPAAGKLLPWRCARCARWISLKKGGCCCSQVERPAQRRRGTGRARHTAALGAEG